MATNTPESLKIIQPFLKLSKEYETRDPVVAYWSRYHAVQVGIKRKTKDNISFLMTLMDVLEKSKQSHNQAEGITNDIVAQAHLENKGMQLFLWADTEDRAARFNKNVVKSFYSASLIFDILTVFGELNDEIIAQRKYSKWKAAYINNCLKKGEIPVPGPVGEGFDENSDYTVPPAGPPDGAGLPYPTQQPNSMPTLPPSNVPPSNVYPPATGNTMGPSSFVQYPVQHQQPPAYQSPTPPATSTASGVRLEATDFTKVQKLCKYAVSALQYEDVPTAIDNLQKALKLLQTGEG